MGYRINGKRKTALPLTARFERARSGAHMDEVDPTDAVACALRRAQEMLYVGGTYSRSKIGFVYFAGAGADVVKIGLSKAPSARLLELQSGNHVELVLLATTPGGRVAERDYHERFARDHIRGEWFKRTPELNAEIKRLSEVGA